MVRSAFPAIILEMGEHAASSAESWKSSIYGRAVLTIYVVDREVKKANRDLSNQLSSYDSPLARIDAVQKKYAQLFGDMKRLEREHIKQKKRADALQKEKDTAKSELTKMVALKDKLEKLSRETSTENRKLRVSLFMQKGRLEDH